MKLYHKLLAGLLLIILIMGLMIVQNYRYFGDVVDTSNWVSHTQEVLFDNDDILVTLTDMQNKAKDYILTGKEENIESFYDLRDSENVKIEYLLQLTSDNPTRVKQYKNIQKLIELKSFHLDSIVSLERNRNNKEAKLLIDSEYGKALMDSIRKLAFKIEQDERALLLKREEENEKHIYNFNVIFFILLLSIVFTVALLSYATFRNFRARENAERQLQEINTDLERKVDERSRQIAESENRYRSLFNQANEGIMIMTPEGIILEINHAFADMHGYTVDEMKSMNIRNLDVLKENTMKDMDDIVSSIKSGKVAHFEVEHFHKDGHIIPFSVTSNLIILNGKNYFQASHVDITEIKSAEKAQQKYAAELEKKVEERTLHLMESLQREKELNELESHFISMASHEFRTPLSAILSSTSLLEIHIKRNDPEKTIAHIKHIKDSVHGLVQLINDFLSSDKAHSGKIETSPSEFELPQMINDVCEEMKNILKEGQNIEYTHKGEEIVNVDSKLLHNILTNLISNASKYSDEGQPIQIISSIDQTEIRIDVSDNGIGIPEKDHSKMFSLFFRAGNVGEIEGSGLGLNIVTKYIELMNGSISFQSQEGKGTTFSVVFPL